MNALTILCKASDNCEVHIVSDPSPTLQEPGSQNVLIRGCDLSQGD